MTNLAPTQRTITTTEELQALVADALVTGKLYINHRIIDVEFNLPTLLQRCGQPEIQTEIVNIQGEKKLTTYVECPFIIYASKSTFNKRVDFNFPRFDYESYYNPDLCAEEFYSSTTFNKEVNFDSTTFHKDANLEFTTFNEKVSFQSATFIDMIKLQSATFNEKVSFQSATFNEWANFLGATFNNKTYFESATFNKQANFESATFNNEAIFKSATFNKHASFQSTTFNGLADFWFTKFNESVAFGALPRIRKLNHEAKHEFATFNNDVDFRSVTFNGDAWFERTVFLKKGEFFKSTFNKYAFFDGATINHQVSFYETTFKQQAHFSHLVVNILPNNSEPIFFRLMIEEKFYFSLQDDCKVEMPINACIFSNNGCLILDYKKQKEEQNWGLAINFMECDGDAVRVKIRNLSEESKAKIEFKDCHFYGKNVAFTNVAMKNVSIDGGNTVKGMLFDHCHFEPTQLTQGLLKNLKFKALAGEEQWLNSQDKEKIKERALIYASLKTTATEGGETQLANDFHFWQQYYQGKLQFSLWNTLYKYTSAYGLSIGLPFWWFVCLFIIGVYFYALTLTNFNATPLQNGIDYFNNLWIKGLPLSVSSSLPFMFADNENVKNLLKEVKITGADLKPLAFYAGYIVQHLAQGFLLFQIGAAIRNKVKR